MKKYTLLFLCFASFGAFAQVKVETGKKITGVTDMVIDMDMGMAGQMKIVTGTTNVISITGAEGNNYTATNTITRIKASQEGMGQETGFDSDKKEDLDSETGKMMGKDLNKPKVITIDKATGKSEDTEKKEEEAGNPMAGIMGNMNSNSGNSGAFFVVPAGKKAGDKWSDSSNADGMKTQTNYELQSIADNMATVLLKSVAAGTTSSEAQGMQFDMTMNAVKNETVIVDTKSGVVKKRSTSGDISGTMDMMGQSIPINAKLNSTAVFE